MPLARRVWQGAVGLWKGLRVTGLHLVRKPVTVLYPYDRREFPNFNGPIELVTFPETGTHDCIACNACVRICPSFCIDVEGKRPEGSKKMRATKFLIDFSTCSLCGLCVEVCPTDTLKYSNRYDEAFYTRAESVNDLLKPFGEDPYLSGKLS
jgi:NADH-quinone oxidoreductase subunit I